VPLAAVVPAPRAEAPRVGLVVSADPPPAGDDDRWTEGLAYEPETCVGFTTVAACTADDMGDPDARTVGNVDYVPFVVLVEDACTTLSGDRGVRDRLRRQLDQVTSYAIAAELWTGTVAQAESYPNLYLTAPDTAAAPFDVVTASAQPMHIALGLLEQALGDCLHGQRGMIHVPRLALPDASRLTAFRRSGSVLLTDVDNIVVPDAGYPVGSGAEPDGQAAATATQAWIFATGMVTVRQTAPTVVPDLDSQAVRTRDNRRIYRAWRTVAATFDPCCRLAALVDLTAG
jgi:hypothetical protein